MIKHVSLAHGWYYHYRIHSEKTERLCNHNHSMLKNYLETTMSCCPEEHFLKGPRSSSLKFSLPIKLEENLNHEISQLCLQSLKTMDNYRTAHSKVQMFMLQFDKNTISIEAPIWMQSEEIQGFEKMFESQDSLSGHIDVLRIQDDGKIWIWDYKPNAEMERFAKTQVYFYALMMSLRTKIPLKEFRCGYFNENVAYTFKPELKILKRV